VAKGDREILKADTDDGYTRIANLLLEALAMAKLNGVQKGICLFIWRRTYGWGVKEDQITLKEFAQACDSEESYVSRQLKKLVDMGIITRNNVSGKAYTFTFNTRVDQWDKGCLNGQGLFFCTRQGLFFCTRVPLSDQTRVSDPSSLEPRGLQEPLKETLKKDINKDNIYTIFEYWNSKGIIKHKELTQATSSVVNARLENGHTVESLAEAIDNYNTVLKSDEYFFSYKWTLKDFFNPKNLDRFFTENDPFTNFRKNKGSGKSSRASPDELIKRLEAL